LRLGCGPNARGTNDAKARGHAARHLSSLLPLVTRLLGLGLLGEASLHQVYRLAPTKEKRELGHLLISGRSRSGKGLHLEAQLLSWPASAIVNDIKGELHHRTAGFRGEEGLGGKVIVFRPKGNGHRYDPLEGLETEFDLQTAATTLLDRPNEGQNQIFTDSAITMLTQIFLAARLEEERPLPFTYKIINEGLVGAATILEIISRKHNVYPNLATVFLDVDFQHADFKDKFLRSCWGTLTKRMKRILTKESVQCFTGSDFTANDLLTSEKPITVYLQWPEKDLVALSPLIHLIWTSLMDGMINYYDDVEGKGCRPLGAFLDEIGRTGFPNLPHYATTVSGREISLVVVVQSPAYFEANYGVYQAKVLRGQLESKIIYPPADYDDAEVISRWLGFTSGFAHSQTNREGGGESESLSEQAVHLVTAEELMLLKDEETMCFRRGIRPFYARRMDWRRFLLLAKRHSMPLPTVAPLPPLTGLELHGLHTNTSDDLINPDAPYAKN
jgi:type IV secretion system protein VirD4